MSPQQNRICSYLCWFPLYTRGTLEKPTCALEPRTHVSSGCKDEFISQNWHLILLPSESMHSMCHFSEGSIISRNFRSTGTGHLFCLTFLKILHHLTLPYLPKSISKQTRLIFSPVAHTIFIVQSLSSYCFSGLVFSFLSFHSSKYQSPPAQVQIQTLIYPKLS